MKKIVDKSKIAFYTVLLSMLFNINVAFAVLIDPPTASETFINNIKRILFLLLVIVMLPVYFYFVLKFIYVGRKDKNKDVAKIKKKISLSLKIVIIIFIIHFLVVSFDEQIAEIYETISKINIMIL